MATYVWQHDLAGEAERLRLMSELLDPSCRVHLSAIPVRDGWRCLEIGAGNGSLSQWLATQVGPSGHVTASDLHPDLMAGIATDAAGGNLSVEAIDVVHDDIGGRDLDLVVLRALLHHLPERMDVIAKLLDAVKPGGAVFIQEPDFYPCAIVEPSNQAGFWSDFLAWAASHQIDYFVGRKVAPRLAEIGAERISAEGHVEQYNGGATYARWWRHGIAEVAETMLTEGGTTRERLDQFFELNADPTYWTQTISFTAVTAFRPH